MSEKLKQIPKGTSIGHRSKVLGHNSESLRINIVFVDQSMRNIKTTKLIVAERVAVKDCVNSGITGGADSAIDVSLFVEYSLECLGHLLLNSTYCKIKKNLAEMPA